MKTKGDEIMRIVLILVALLSLTSFASASSVTVSVSDATGGNGATVEVPINLADATDIGSMDIRMSYDPEVLQAIGVDTGELGSNAYIESNTASAWEIVIALADASGISGDGAVAVVTFEVPGEMGSSSFMKLEDVSVHDIERVEVTTTTVDGTFTVTDEAKSTGYESITVLSIGAILAALFFIKKRE